MKLLFSIIISALSVTYSSGADLKYPVSSIPSQLKEGTYAVVREEITQHRILSIQNTTLTYRKVITILNGKAKDLAELNVYYDKFTSVKSIKAFVYDQMGREIRKLKQNELSDRSTYDGFAIFSD
ncbi:MAG: DUF3857 domain-containing protein, partial [Cyclobacteriaceae bacterium]